MLKLKHLAICILIISQISSAQSGITHEIGVITGPLQFRSDYGNSNNSETNSKNSGFGMGIVYYLNFAYIADYNYRVRNSYLFDHFKLRNEISFNSTDLEHAGEWVAPNKTSIKADQLRGHTGQANNLDIGTQLEFFPFSIRTYQAYRYKKFAPFISFGAHYTLFSPKVETNYNNPNPIASGDVTDSSNFYSDWLPGSVDASSGSAWSVVSSIGLRYKINRSSDLMLDLRAQYYFSDWVDGLNHQLESNKNNDWLVWLNIGYIYYLN